MVVVRLGLQKYFYIIKYRTLLALNYGKKTTPPNRSFFRFFYGTNRVVSPLDRFFGNRIFLLNFLFLESRQFHLELRNSLIKSDYHYYCYNLIM